MPSRLPAQWVDIFDEFASTANPAIAYFAEWVRKEAIGECLVATPLRTAIIDLDKLSDDDILTIFDDANSVGMPEEHFGLELRRFLTFVLFNDAPRE